MRRFYDDSSQAKTFSSDRSIHAALRFLSKKPLAHYELRDYSKNPYFVVTTFISKNAAMAAKSFHEFQEGSHFAVVAVDPYTSEYNRPRG